MMRSPGPQKKKCKTWRDHLDERMMRLRYSDETMIHFRKSKDYMNITKLDFKNNEDCINGVIEVEEMREADG